MTVEAVLDLDMNAFTSTMTVDPSDTTKDFTALEPAAAAEVRTFAADVASSYASSVATTLGLDSSTVSVSCLYRLADEAKLNLLTLEDTCSADRLLGAASASDARRLQTAGFGVEVDLDGSAVDQIAASGGSTEVAESLSSAEVVIESDFIPGGSMSVEVQVLTVEVPTASPTPAPTSNPCICQEEWNPSVIADLAAANPGCAVPLGGCPDPACDGREYTWCVISNPGCDEEEANATSLSVNGSVNGSGWAYCTPALKVRQSLALEMSVTDAEALVAGFLGKLRESITAAFRAALAQILGLSESEIVIKDICFAANAVGSPPRCTFTPRRKLADAGRLLVGAGSAEVQVDYEVVRAITTGAGVQNDVILAQMAAYGFNLIAELEAQIAAITGLAITITALTASSVEDVFADPQGSFYVKLAALFGLTTADLIVAAALATGHEPTIKNVVDFGLAASPLFRVEYGRVCGRARRLSCPYVAGARGLMDCSVVLPPGEVPAPEKCTPVEEPEWMSGTSRFATWPALFAYADAVAVTWPGGPCGVAGQFMDLVGQLAVTKRVDIGRHFIIEPGAAASLELTGVGLKQDADRLMLIDCQGTCGLTAPSASVVYPDASASGTFAAYQPVRDVDREAAALRDEACPNFNHTEDPFLVAESFEVIPARYCTRGALAGAAVHAIEAPVAARLAELYACSRCAEDPQATPFCGGFLGLAGNILADAVCLPRYECEHLCILAGDACHSVSMHETLPRCFLNPPACAVEVETDLLGVDKDYVLLVKRAVPEDSRAEAVNVRDLEEIDWLASSRGNLLSPSDGASSSSILRFAPLEIPAAGTFKVCFCDSELSTGGCKSKADFPVEVGRLHLSGLSCLLTLARLRRAACVEQYFGGLRCVQQS